MKSNEYPRRLPPILALRRSALGLLAAALLIPTSSNAQAPYVVTRDSNIGYTSLPNTSTVVGGGVDTHHPVTLPFPFAFFGQTYTQILVGTNGYITFPGNNASVWNSWPLPDPTKDPKPLIALWWYWQTCPADGIRSQLSGTAPSRRFTIEWRSCHRWNDSSGTWQAKLILDEGSSTITTEYGTHQNTSVFPAGQLVVGIQNQTATQFHLGLANQCNKCGGSDWPTDTRITYSQGPQLRVSEVRVPFVAYAGVPAHVEATVSNVGGKPADGFTARFWINSVASLTDGAIDLGLVPGLVDLDPGDSADFTLDPRLPIHLTPGSYYIIAEADPHHAVPVNSRGSSISASPPMTIGLPAPNLIPTHIVAPERIAPGSQFTLNWVAQNIGNAEAVGAPYRVVLSTHVLHGPSSRVLYESAVDIPVLDAITMADTIAMPADVVPGQYHLGVIMDPDGVIYEHEISNNIGSSDAVQVADDLEVHIVSSAELPPAEVGGLYSVTLLAGGGDGVYSWSVAAGSSLPPGLSLRESPAGAREAGRPFSTALQGALNQAGEFGFTLEVESAGIPSAEAFRLTGLPSGLPLQIGTSELPQAFFDRPYTAHLSAIGGTPPYHWKVIDGSLPQGLLLDPEGRFSGAPMKDGTFIATIRVSDASGSFAEKGLDLVVLPPNSLVCSTRQLPTKAIDEPYDEYLLAAGGRVSWTTRETRYLAGGHGEESQSRPGEAPPGLSLRADGRVTGAPTRAGAYLWNFDVVEVLDRETMRQPLRPITCEIRLEVRLDRGLTVGTQALPPAVVNQGYTAQLQASGGEGALTWSLMPGSTLPEGLTLDASGLILGSPTDPQLDGEESRLFPFLVHVADPHNRTARVTLSILVEQPRTVHVPKEKRVEGGCQAASAESSVLALLAALGFAARHRRAEGEQA